MHQLRRFASFRLILIAVCFAGLDLATPEEAQAKEVPVVAALCDAIEAQLGVRPEYRRVKKAKDGTITILGLTTEVKAAKTANRRIRATLSVERTTLSGITKEPDGLFDVADAKLTNLILISDEEVEAGGALRLPEVNLTHLHLPPAGGQTGVAVSILPLGVEAQSLTAKNGMLSSAGTSLEIGSIEASWQSEEESGVARMHLKVDDIHYPAAMIRRSDPSGVVLSLIGGGDLIFDLWGTTITTPSGGTFEAALSARSLGQFKISGNLAGRSLGALASAPPVSQSDAAVAGAAGVSPSVSRFTIRFEDQSLTGKLLALLASDQGMDREGFIAGAAAAAEAVLSDIENPSLHEMLKSAILAFLREPKSFTVSSQLTQPVPVRELIEGVAGGPSDFLSRFPASVTAND